MQTNFSNRSLRTARFPLVAVTICFGSGILLAPLLEYNHTSIAVGVGMLLFSLIVILSVKQQRSFRYRSYLNLPLLVLFVLLGFWKTNTSYLPNHADFFYPHLSKEDFSTSLVKINSIQAGEKSLRLNTSVQSVISTKDAVATTGNLLVYLPYHSKSSSIKIGDQLLVRGEPKQIPPPKNPYAFDGQQYWNKKQVFHRIYLKDKDSYKHIANTSLHLKRTAEHIRDQWQKSFEAHLSGNELAVAAALVLGKKDLLNEDIRNAYADTGAIHVLAVSGLHVGIVNLIFSFLFGLLKKNSPPWRTLKLILTLLGIWGFAFLTGLSPSVQRASLMFSFLSLGQLSSRKGHLLNTLAAAALCILMIDPFQLFQVGFQLSFAAVVGIGLFQARLEQVWTPYWKLNRIIWSASTVSIAATLGTLPFSLYYFHQFPIYFLLIGTIVIATAFGIMIVGFIHALFSLVSGSLAAVSGYLLNLAIGLQNSIVFLGKQLPGAHQDTAWINTPQFLLILTAILLLGIWFKSRSWKLLALALIAIFSFSLFGLRSSKALNEQQRLVLYSLRDGFAMDIINGRRAVRLLSEDIEPLALQFATKQHQLARRYTLDTSIILNSLTPSFTNDYMEYHPPFLVTTTGNWWLPQTQETPTKERLLEQIPPIDYSFSFNRLAQSNIEQWPFLTENTRLISLKPYFFGTQPKAQEYFLNQSGALVVEQPTKQP